MKSFNPNTLDLYCPTNASISLRFDESSWFKMSTKPPEVPGFVELVVVPRVLIFDSSDGELTFKLGYFGGLPGPGPLPLLFPNLN